MAWMYVRFENDFWLNTIECSFTYVACMFHITTQSEHRNNLIDEHPKLEIYIDMYQIPFGLHDVCMYVLTKPKSLNEIVRI